MRTQVIGDAGEGNTALKVEIHTLKTRIKEIFHRKFLWNETKISIDGALKISGTLRCQRSFLSPSIEVQDKLSSLTSADDLLNLWNQTYEVAGAMRDHYSTLIDLQNLQAKQNRISSVTHSLITPSKCP